MGLSRIIERPAECDIAWAAGLFIGEGCLSIVAERADRRYVYLTLQLGMYDERAIARFARIFQIPHAKSYLPKQQHEFFKVHVRGRTAERIVALMWPHLQDSDKGDQALDRARKLNIEPWITGDKTGIRPQDHREPRGLKPGSARKLSASVAAQIRLDGGTLRGLAVKYDVSPRLIGMIRRGQIWKET